MTITNPALVGAAMALTIAAASESYALEIPKLTGWVVDQAGVLQNIERLELENELIVIAKNQGGEHHPQVAILIPKTLQGYEISDYANQVFKSWKLGEKGKDNGVLLVFAPNERKARIEVGYGLEGSLPDSRTREILGKMGPSIVKKEWFKALGTAITEIAKHIKGD